MPAFDAGASHGPSGRFASLKADFERAAFVDEEGVGETSGQRPDLNFERAFCSKGGPAEETGFLRSVRIA